MRCRRVSAVHKGWRRLSLSVGRPPRVGWGTAVKRLSVPIAVEILVPIRCGADTKHRDVVVTTVLPHGDPESPTSFKAISASYNHPSDQLVEAHCRYAARKAIRRFEQVWGVSWFDLGGDFWFELTVVRSIRPPQLNPGDADNVGKLVMDGVAGEGSLFADDRRVRDFAVTRGATAPQAADWGQLVRVMPADTHARLMRGQQPALGIVAPAEMAPHSKCSQMGVPTFTSPDELLFYLRSTGLDVHYDRPEPLRDGCDPARMISVDRSLETGT